MNVLYISGSPRKNGNTDYLKLEGKSILPRKRSRPIGMDDGFPKLG
jgi:hypothetical protein